MQVCFRYFGSHRHKYLNINGGFCSHTVQLKDIWEIYIMVEIINSNQLLSVGDAETNNILIFPKATNIQ